MSAPIFPKLNCACGTEDYDLTDADIIKNLDELSLNMSHEVSAYTALVEEVRHTPDLAQYRTMYPSLEDFSFRSIEDILETIRNHKVEALGYVTLRILAKCYNVVVHALNFTGNQIMNYGTSSAVAAQIWETYLKLRIRSIDRDLLESVQTEVFPFEIMQKATQISLRSLDFCMQLETVCTDTSTAVITSKMKDITKELNAIGIVPSLIKGKVDMSKFLDERRFGDMSTLGYDASLFPNLIRYCKDLSSGALSMTKVRLSPVQLKFEAFSNRLSDEMEHINASVEDGTLEKNSKEYRTRVDRLMVYASRLAYCTQVLEAGCNIANMISSDLKNMFYRMHSALVKID